MTQPSGRTDEALRELTELTTCRCLPAWTDRGLHETTCVASWRVDVDTLRAALEKADPEVTP